MRESNFAFPAQNRASVCISSQLYDRRALDTNSPLPLFNSLTHLAYLTSTSPRIREIMTMDGGLERLVRILHEYCMSPTPPENPATIYGLLPSNFHPPQPAPTLNPKLFDKQAAYRFSLAFQCVVNIGVRGSEPIRSRVVQAGTLDVVGCILEAWLASKGFAVGPSTSASGMPRESREQRLVRRQAQAEQRQRDQAAQLARALQRQIAVEEYARYERTSTGMDMFSVEDEAMRDASVPAEDPPSSVTSVDTDTSADASFTGTPDRSTTPNRMVTVRERSGTVIARPNFPRGESSSRLNLRRRGGASGSASTDNSRPETETEDDGDVDMDRDQTDTSPDRRSTTAQNTPHNRRAVGIVSDSPPTTNTGASLEVNADAHIIINNGPQDGLNEVGVEDGIVSLDTNDDFAMGAPPGAPGAIDGTTPVTTQAEEARMRGGPPDVTPRATTTDLPALVPLPLMQPRGALDLPRHLNPVIMAGGRFRPRGNGGGVGHERHHEGPYRDEDVLLSLQLLAYLSKYPHVRQHFYRTRPSFHPATVTQASTSTVNKPGPSNITGHPVASSSKEPHAILKVFASATGRGKEKEKAGLLNVTPPARQTNVFSLVERFTFRPSSSESELPNPPPTLPAEIQYWAGVIMRNACRKDESRGGIRQCANMLCGRWETYPREFAKCRRCRKAKYCGKECQSTAWSEGHRFWCSAKDPEDDGEHHSHDRRATGAGVVGDGRASALMTATSGGTVTGRAERRAERERERHRALGTLQGTETGGADTVRPIFRANVMIGPNVTLATLNGRPTTTTRNPPQFDYLRQVNARPGHDPRATSPDPPTQRVVDTAPSIPLADSSSDLPAQLRPYLIGPSPGPSSAGPSRPGTSSPFGASGVHHEEDVDMIVS